MAGILKNLMAMGVSAGLADKQAFVDKLASQIEAYQLDPAKAEQWAQAAVNFMEEFKENIRVQNNISAAVSDSNLPKQKTVEELTQAIKQLTEEIQHLKGLK